MFRKSALTPFRQPSAEQIQSAYEASAQGRADMLADPRPKRLPLDLFIEKDIPSAMAAGQVIVTMSNPVFAAAPAWEVVEVIYDPSKFKRFTVVALTGQQYEFSSAFVNLFWVQEF